MGKAGRPFGTLKYDNLEELEKGIEEYFANCDANEKPYTISGLADYLNISTVTLMNYGREQYNNGEYFSAINSARQRCLTYAENRLYDKDGVQGAKFYLTNNAERMGGLRYADRQEVSMDVAPITFVDDLGI